MGFKKEILIFSLCLFTANAMRFGGMMVGGWNEWNDATDEVQDVADSVRDAAEAQHGPFEMYNAASFKSQVVAGTNYNIRVDVGQETYLEIVVYQHWSGRTSLTSADFSDEYVPPPLIEECEQNQEFTACGTACPKICGEPEAIFCTMQCVIGCQCPGGWWQKEDGSCVEHEDECYDIIVDTECPHNQEFNECGTACPKICGEPEPLLCTMQCEIGCQCPWSWWQKEDGSCVETEDECGSSDPDCQDDNDSCEHWASIGECCNNPGYMLSNCAKACGQCGDKPDISCKCEDKNDQCPQWAADGECCKNEDYMLENCKESCSQCGEVNEVPECPCMNYDRNCEGWAKAGECESNPGFMLKSCAKACGECGIPELIDSCASNPCGEECHCENDPTGDYYCICPIIEPLPIEFEEPVVDPGYFPDQQEEIPAY